MSFSDEMVFSMRVMGQLSIPSTYTESHPKLRRVYGRGYALSIPASRPAAPLRSGDVTGHTHAHFLLPAMFGMSLPLG
jgi:hypothetical protein